MAAEGVRIEEVLRAYLRKLVEERANGNRSAFARLVGIPPGDITNILNAECGREVTRGHLQRISTKLGIPISEIMFDLAKFAARLEQTVPQTTGPLVARGLREQLRGISEAPGAPTGDDDDAKPPSR